MMKVSRYFRLPASKKILYICIAIICLVISIHFGLSLKWLFNNCDEVDENNSRINQEFSEKAIEKLKRQWQEEQLQIFNKHVDEPPNNDLKVHSVSNVECLINDDYPIQCLQDNDNHDKIYMPFDFIEKYFEVTGKLKHYDGYNRFEFSQSYSKLVYETKEPYTYHGVFMTFTRYYVENRASVKCISGKKGVPITIQWDVNGYFYPIQIAQYGLSHYSKNLVEKPAHVSVYEDGEHDIQTNWKKSNRQYSVSVVFDPEVNSNVVKFATPETTRIGSGVTLNIEKSMESILSFDIKFISNGSLSVVVDTSDKIKQYTIHYIPTNLVIDNDKHSNIYIGLGEKRKWRHLARNLAVDLIKGMSFKGSNLKGKVKIHKVSRIILRGEGYLDNVTVSKTAHLDHFRDSLNWLVDNQDAETGAWKNDIRRTFSNKNAFESIPPGWTSAMGQGQAMSTLARGYFLYGEKAYIKAMSRGLLPFTVMSEQGGVRAMFMDKYVWYEEYPTKPSSFVLNGFIFSLFGLSDLKSLLEDKFNFSADDDDRTVPDDDLKSFTEIGVDLKETYKLVCELLEDGLNSLRAMLPLYDGGSRTFYDLRHFAFKIQPNVARWDYHTTHLSQLAMLVSITDDPIFKRYLEYWTGYLKGKVAPHN